jgi:hypothetical protein
LHHRPLANRRSRRSAAQRLARSLVLKFREFSTTKSSPTGSRSKPAASNDGQGYGRACLMSARGHSRRRAALTERRLVTLSQTYSKLLPRGQRLQSMRRAPAGMGMCENATHSRRMMEAIVQSGSAGISGPLGSVPPGKKGRADSLLNTSAIVARRSFQALPPSGLSSVGRWIENISRANCYLPETA